MTKVAEFRDRSADQLSDELTKLKKEQFNLRFQRASGQLENTARFRVVRRHIARIMTVLGQMGTTPPAAAASKPAEVRMGSGKGTPELWVARVKPGRVIFEIDGVTVQTAKEALSLAAAKLPIKTRFVARIAE